MASQCSRSTQEAQQRSAQMPAGKSWNRWQWLLAGIFAFGIIDAAVMVFLALSV